MRIIRISVLVVVFVALEAFRVSAQIGGQLGNSEKVNLPSSPKISELVAQIELTLGVNIIYDSMVNATWTEVQYELPSDTNSLIRFLELLKTEYAKYPSGYFDYANVKTIALAQGLRYGTEYRAAVPDPYQTTLYLSVDGGQGDSSATYLVHVMHHELNHCAEYGLWSNMYYNWKKWKRTNKCLFRYKSSGDYAYHHLYIDWYSMCHPKKGFVNLYSTLSQEEDRSEIVALLMSDIERHFLIEICAKDKIVLKKTLLAINMMNLMSRTVQNYWTENTAGIISE